MGLLSGYVLADALLGIYHFFKQHAAKVTGFVIIALILSLLPTVHLPYTLMNFLAGGTFKGLMNIMYYFFPVDFVLNCISIILVLKYGEVILQALMWVFHLPFFKSITGGE